MVSTKPSSARKEPKITATEQRAIDVLNAYVEEHKQCPKHVDMARELDVSRLPARTSWPSYYGRYDKLKASLPTRPVAQPIAAEREEREQKAIEFQDSYAQKHGCLPSYEVVGLAIGAATTTPINYREFRRKRALLEKRLGSGGGGAVSRAKREAREAKAIEFQEQFARENGCLPSLPTLARAAGASPGRVWSAFQAARLVLAAKYGTTRGAAKKRAWAARQAAAIEFQDEFARRNGKVPPLATAAKKVGCKTATLLTWPQFMATRGVWEAKLGRVSRGRQGIPAERIAKAIQFQEDFAKRNGRLPTLLQLTGKLGCRSATTVSRCGPLWEARKKLEAEFGKNGAERLGAQRAAREAQAIKIFEEAQRSGGDLPSPRQIADALGVGAKNLSKYLTFYERYKAAQAAFLLPTPWGQPANWREGQFIAKLVKETDETGRVPSIEEFEAIAHCDWRHLRTLTVLRAAYEDLAKPEGEGAPAAALSAARADRRDRQKGEEPEIDQAAGNEQGGNGKAAMDRPAALDRERPKRDQPAGRRGKCRGQYKTPFSRDEDRRLSEDWKAAHAAGTPTIAAFARDRGLNARKVGLALERVRNRRRRTSPPVISDGRQ